jgi:two-component system, chemotaxis family, chemotaxis protein CheY
MPINVLVVDDSAVMRAIMLKTLGMSGLPLGSVHQAADGAAALALLQEHEIDLVMLDISMPVMRGDEMLEQLRMLPHGATLPVIVVSSERSTERMQRMQQLGALFLQKPFAPEQVRALLTDIMEYRDELCPR